MTVRYVYKPVMTMVDVVEGDALEVKEIHFVVVKTDTNIISSHIEMYPNLDFKIKSTKGLAFYTYYFDYPDTIVDALMARKTTLELAVKYFVGGELIEGLELYIEHIDTLVDGKSKMGRS